MPPPKKKEVMARVKLLCPAGQATPAPPVGPALGQHGVNIGAFVSKFNEATRKDAGILLPVIVTIYKDRSFDFVVKSPPASVLLKRAANIVQGSGRPNRDFVGQVTRAQVREIARTKMADLNATDIEAAARMIEGTARNMGIKVVEG
jgi:large subunit ribosomal protein L11